MANSEVNIEEEQENMRMLEAAEKGDVKEVERLLQEGENIETSDVVS